MLNWFTEEPLIPLVTGVLLFIVFAIFAVMSRERVMVYCLAVIALVTIAIVTCEALIVTEKEQLTEEVYQLAFAVQRNDVERVVASVDPNLPDVIKRVQAEMPRYRFDTCRLMGITDYKSTGQNPDSAEIEFTVTFRLQMGDDPTALTGQRRVRLNFRKDSNGKWKITDYMHEDPRSHITI